MKNSTEYPIVRRDHLNRVVWTKNSQTNEIVRDFWGETNVVKIIYRKYNNDYVIDIYDKNSNHLFEITKNTKSIKMKEGFTMNKKEISFKIQEETCLEWSKKLNKKI